MNQSGRGYTLERVPAPCIITAMGLHHHHHDHEHGNSSVSNIRLAFILNFVFAIIELVGGILVGSHAIQSDAIHDFGDSIALGFALVMEKMSKRKSSATHSYGYRRLSLISSLVTGFALLGGSIYIVARSIPKLSSPEMPHLNGMIGLAILGLAVNGFAAWKLQHGHGHNEKVLSWHLWEDVMGWAAVLVISVVMRFVHLPILDPILSIIIAIVIFVGAIRAIAPSVQIILQTTPKGVDMEGLSQKIRQILHVESIHDFHCWSLDGQNHVASIHVVVKNAYTTEDGKKIKEGVRNIVNAQHQMHITIEIETRDEASHCALHACV